MTPMSESIRSIAIAGAWGYIGRKLLDAAVHLGLRVYAYDPAPVPADVDPSRCTLVSDPAEFYRLPVELYHLALHPQHRQPALGILLDRARHEPLLILNEKPMAEPETPQACAATVAAVEATQAIMLFDFLELYDPMTQAIVEHLSRSGPVQIDAVRLYRGKDREDPRRPRNYKKMVHIQYQETVHCIAFLLHLLGSLRGGLRAVLDQGLTVTAHAQPYAPPNPEAYPYVVDGQVTYRLQLGDVQVDGRTDFKAGAPFAKTKTITGRAGGRPFVVEADYLEGAKRLAIDGRDMGFARDASGYEHILRTLAAWRQRVSPERLMRGVYPNPRFARLTYQISSVLWRSCWTGRPIALRSYDELLGFAADFAAAVPQFARYAAPAPTAASRPPQS